MHKQDPTSEPAMNPACGFSCLRKEANFASAVSRVTQAWKAAGFGALTDIDCMDPVAVLQMTGNAKLARVAHEVHERLQRVRAGLMATAVNAAG